MPDLPKFKYWPADLVADNVVELIKLYEMGFAGAIHDPAADEAAVDAMTYKTFADVAHENGMAGDGEGKLSLAYEVVLQLNPKEYPGKAQTTGCCVSRSTVNAFAVSYAYEVVNGLRDPDHNVAELWPEVPYPDHQTFDHSTIYGERGHRGQGANCGTLAIAARDKTGLVPRGKYEIPGYGSYDCSKYDDNFAARTGPTWPQAFRQFANQKHVRDVTTVRTKEETRDAIANNYGISFCSGYATNSRRPSITDDKGNECAGAQDWRGSWAHAEMAGAFDDRPWISQLYRGESFLVGICNSWAAWNSGPTRIYGTDKHLPPGWFWMRGSDWLKCIRSGGAYVLSNVKGFPRRPLIVEFW